LRTATYKYNVTGKNGNPNNISIDSSLGPTKNTVPNGPSNSRIKPDVVAPGEVIYSARSTEPGARWPHRTAPAPGVVQVNDFNHYGVSPDPLMLFSAGTSMACPLVAGCCAVIRSSLLPIMNPLWVTSALIKAMIVN